MLKEVSAGMNRLLASRSGKQDKNPRDTMRGGPKGGPKRLKLALQGGGAHGAFTWGVLDYLLEDGRISISGISGASAGAMNAVMLADGLARGGPEEARKRLADFWRAVSLGGNLPPAQQAVMRQMLSLLPAGVSPVQLFVDTMTRFARPHDFNPLNLNPLKDLIERFADFDAVRAYTPLELFIAATNVQTGQLRIFRREEITPKVVMASAAMPIVFRAVTIDGEDYWDGGYTGNPPLLPLIDSPDQDDVLLIRISPLYRETTPTSKRDIRLRGNEIAFNASLDTELRALNYAGVIASCDKDQRASGGATRQINLHQIALASCSKRITLVSSMKTDFEFFSLLHRVGRRAARRFLDQHFDDIGACSTVDLTGTAA